MALYFHEVFLALIARFLPCKKLTLINNWNKRNIWCTLNDCLTLISPSYSFLKSIQHFLIKQKKESKTSKEFPSICNFFIVVSNVSPIQIAQNITEREKLCCFILPSNFESCFFVVRKWNVKNSIKNRNKSKWIKKSFRLALGKKE